MNLLVDMPIHVLYQKLTTKSANAPRECQLKHFTVYDLLVAIGDGNCQYTGKPFENENDATFERINPNLGYVKGNVVMVSSKANSHKSQLDHFVKGGVIPIEKKIKLMRKALYQLEKSLT